MKNKYLLLSILVLLAVSIYIIVRMPTSKYEISTPPSSQGVACTDEAKQCPDGSYVGRTGPQCQFSECPTTGIVNPPANPIASGIKGVVMLGPTCPVMRNPPDPQCADKPYQTTLAVSIADGTRTISTVTSDSQGKFMVNLPYGTYVVQSADTRTMYPRCHSDGSIIVNANRFTEVTISCDTGIR